MWHVHRANTLIPRHTLVTQVTVTPTNRINQRKRNRVQILNTGHCGVVPWPAPAESRQKLRNLTHLKRLETSSNTFQPPHYRIQRLCRRHLDVYDRAYDWSPPEAAAPKTILYFPVGAHHEQLLRLF